jgi:60 kDa SS-A/Ro ribonucleoprotein
MARKSRKNVNFKDAIMLTHPKIPSIIIKKILNDELAVPITWETEISKHGNKKEVWENLIINNKIPIMALVRNLNNFAKSGINNDCWDLVFNKLTDKEIIKKSKMFPFRFYTAYKNIEVNDTFLESKIKNCLEKTINISIDNLPRLQGRTVIGCDLSGSMNFRLSNNSNITYKEISALMGGLSSKICNENIIYAFGDDIENITPTGNVMNDTFNILNTNVGHSTYGYLIFEKLINNGITADRIIIFTDEELYNDNKDFIHHMFNTNNKFVELYNTYKKTNPDVILYIVNLNGYGESCIDYKTKNIISVSGWSDNILEFISKNETGGKNFIDEIRNYDIIVND